MQTVRGPRALPSSDMATDAENEELAELLTAWHAATTARKEETSKYMASRGEASQQARTPEAIRRIYKLDRAETAARHKYYARVRELYGGS